MLLISAVLNSMGSVLIKFASRGGVAQKFEVLFSWPFLVGALCFGLSLIFFARSLAYLKLSVAYPALVGMTVIFVSLSAIVIFSERLSAWHWGGAAAVVIGITILSTKTG